MVFYSKCTAEWGFHQRFEVKPVLGVILKLFVKKVFPGEEWFNLSSETTVFSQLLFTWQLYVPRSRICVCNKRDLVELTNNYAHRISMSELMATRPETRQDRAQGSSQGKTRNSRTL